MTARSAVQPAVTSTDALMRAVHSSTRVDGLTHNYYRYPARFSPEFARAAIEAFTRPGDVVLDPFMGGGTSLVEGLAAGRRVIGCDLNPLATFVADAKTSPLTNREVAQLVAWQQRLSDATKTNRKVPWRAEWDEYHAHIPWWLKKTFQRSIDSADRLPSSRIRMVARCSIARSAQWALDCRKHLPTRSQFLSKHSEHLEQMLSGAIELRQCLEAIHGPSWRALSKSDRRILTRSAAGLDQDARYPKDWKRPSLIVTSPPYAGVHILYNRWQVQGRRETAAPFWLVGRHNGNGPSHFTFGDRKRGMNSYLPNMRAAYSSIVKLMNSKTTLLQLVAFSDPERHLPTFLDELGALGLRQVELAVAEGADHHAVRLVPNRRWYAQLNGASGASKEFLLIHRRR